MSLKKRPNRQGKPLRPRSKPVQLPIGRFRFRDDQWNAIVEQWKFPPDARKELETYISMYRNGLAERHLPPWKTEQNLRSLSKAAEKFSNKFERVTDDDRAWDLFTRLPNWDLDHTYRLANDLIELPKALSKAADSVQPTHPGTAGDWNLFYFVNALAEMWEKHTGTKFTRTKKRKTLPHAIDFIAMVGQIANPHVHLDTLENVIRSVAEKRPWEN